MSTFRELGVKEVERRFVGKKIKNKSEVVGKKISILDFEICPSKKMPKRIISNSRYSWTVKRGL